MLHINRFEYSLEGRNSRTKVVKMSETNENPPMRTMLDNHELARRTITQHNTDLAIFDDTQLAILKRFVMDPSPETRNWVLEQSNSLEPEDTPEPEIGRLAANHGSLVGLVVARYGRVRDDHHTFTPGEGDALREWFRSGGDALN